MRLKDKTAIITGGASGIGEASVRRFAREGCDVTIADINPAGEALAESIRAEGGRAAFVQTDVAKFSAIQALFDAHMARCGTLDILFNNAGKDGSGQSVAETTEAELDLLLTVNFKSVFLACKLAAPIMTKAGRGSIISTSAGSAREGLAWPNIGAYIASKGAIISFTRALAMELSPQGVRVNSLNPGVTDTPMLRGFAAKLEDPEAFWESMNSMQLLHRLGTSDELAAGALFLASDESSYVTGTDLLVDGGLVLG
jgi:NAD(P)-dependent dehydrogenase (short-subunit alcohol dehydrogenase family)